MKLTNNTNTLKGLKEVLESLPEEMRPAFSNIIKTVDEIDQQHRELQERDAYIDEIENYTEKKIDDEQNISTGN